MKYDERVCKFNMDTGCVELLLRDGRRISINCIGVEDALDVTMAQRSELDHLIYNDPLAYAELILNGEPEEYLRNVAGSHGLEDWRSSLLTRTTWLSLRVLLSSSLLQPIRLPAISSR